LGAEDQRVAALRAELERALGEKLQEPAGCWPLLVGLLGLAWGVLLLAEAL